MPIEIRRNRTQAPQVTREKPGLRFTDANFSSRTLAAGIANIYDLFPRDGFHAWDGDMMIYTISGHLTIEEEGGERQEVPPGSLVHVSARTRYRWHQMNDDDVLVAVFNPYNFNLL